MNSKRDLSLRSEWVPREGKTKEAHRNCLSMASLAYQNPYPLLFRKDSKTKSKQNDSLKYFKQSVTFHTSQILLVSML